MSAFASPVLVKPVATGAVAAALDRYFLKQQDMKRSLYFGGSVAVGTAAATILTPMVPNIIPIDIPAGDEKTLTGRIVEIALGSASAWGINKFILKNESSREEWTKRLGVIVASGFIGEYITDYLAGNPLSYFE